MGVTGVRWRVCALVGASTSRVGCVLLLWWSVQCTLPDLFSVLPFPGWRRGSGAAESNGLFQQHTAFSLPQHIAFFSPSAPLLYPCACTYEQADSGHVGLLAVVVRALSAAPTQGGRTAWHPWWVMGELTGVSARWAPHWGPLRRRASAVSRGLTWGAAGCVLLALAADPCFPARPPRRRGGRRAHYPHRFRVSPRSSRARPPQEKTPSAFPAACVWRPPACSTIPTPPSSGVDLSPATPPHEPAQPRAHQWQSHPIVHLPFSAPSNLSPSPPPHASDRRVDPHLPLVPVAGDAELGRRGQGLPLPLHSHPQPDAVLVHLLLPLGDQGVSFRHWHPFSQPSAATNRSAVTIPACA